HDVVRVDDKLMIAQTNAVAGRGLSGNGYVRVLDDDILLQVDQPANAEHHDPRSIRLAGGAEAAGAGVVQVGHGDHGSAASSRSIGAESLSSWKRGSGCGQRCRAE